MPSGGCILLGEVTPHLATLDVACNRCERHGKVSTARLLEQHGPDMPIPDLLRILAADCPRQQARQMHDVCGVHLPQLPALFVPTIKP